MRAAAPRPAKTGTDLLHDPLRNKGTAFTRAERAKLGLLGLLPPYISTMSEQAARALKNVRARATDLEKYIDMLALMDRNETLYYKLVTSHIEELMPIIYTPTVGKGCQLYAHIFRRARGIFITRREKGMVERVLRNWPNKDVRVIVVTDGERILGLGDLGASGMGIPVGKLALYTACGGVPPECTLPVTLDVGTNNPALRGDPLYLGVSEPRLTGTAYDALVSEFITAVQKVFPKALIQFEDFANHNAFRLLEKYRDKVCCFNDDIQGTAAVTLAGLYSACRVKGTRLRDETILFLGAGEAAIGIGELIVSALEAEGLSKAEAKKKCWFMDSKALVESTRTDLQEHKKAFAHDHAPVATLAEAVRSLKPTALIGVSGQAAQFTQEIVADMSRLNPRPVVFALSNPTSQAECTAEQAYSWSDGRALFASGSPFPSVTHKGKVYAPGQGNNAYIFPGVGMGAVTCGAKRVTHEMFFEAARTLAGLVTENDLAMGCLFPALSRIREVSAHIAAATCAVAYKRRLAAEPRPRNILAAVKARQFKPEYKRFA